jgi:hypothetical protein
MPTDLGPDEAVERARQLLDPRFGSIRQLADRRAALTEARRVIDEAEVADAQAYAEALRAGWSEADLKAVGFDAPERRLPGRPRRNRKQTGAAGEVADAAASSNGQQDLA